MKTGLLEAKGLFGTGLIFLPKYGYEAILCMEAVTRFIRQEGLELIGYHDVAVDPAFGGDSMELGESYLTQVFITGDLDENLFKLKLGRVRRQAEQQIHASKLKHRGSFSVCSLTAINQK